MPIYEFTLILNSVKIPYKINYTTNVANDAAATAAAQADPAYLGGGQTSILLRPLTTTEAAARNMATETTLAAMAANIAFLVTEAGITQNSTSTPINAAATFAGSFQSVSGYEGIRLTVRVDQDSAANGMVVSWSEDGTNATASQSYTVLAANGFDQEFPIQAPYVKVAYTNGGVNQGSFNLVTTKLPRFAWLGSSSTPYRFDPVGTTTQPSSIVGTTKTILRASISIAVAADNAIIAAPGMGLKIKIIHLELYNTTAGPTTNTAILKSAGNVLNGAGIVIPTNSPYTFQSELFPLVLNSNEAFNINLAQATNVSGLVIYYIEA